MLTLITIILHFRLTDPASFSEKQIYVNLLSDIDISFFKQPLFAAFVYFRRAFDMFNRNMMLGINIYKLAKKNIDGIFDHIDGKIRGKIIRLLFIPANRKHLYNIYTTSAQRLRRSFKIV